jgi:hypothetical protein
MRFITLTFIFLVTYTTFAQNKCGVVLYDSLQATKIANWQSRKSQFESQIKQFSQTTSQLRIMAFSTIRIPVVVHIVHNNSSGTIGGSNNNNISDEQIASQIEALNDDYRRKSGTAGYNTNPVGADMQLEFYLADSLAQGQTTKGITRHYINHQSFDFIAENTTLAQISTWNPLKYLNIYVTRSNGRAIGYSGFPYDSFLEGLNPNASDLSTQQIFDGIIIDYRYFGRCCGNISQVYNLGRTTTHEIGHWLGLLHPNGDTSCGNDYCDDTPTIEKLNLETNCNPLTSTCNGITVSNQIQNYMDYSPDACMNLFTNDQKNRTRAALELSYRRKSLINNAIHLPESNTLQVSIEPNPVQNNANIKVLLEGSQNITIQIYNLAGVLVWEETHNNQSSTYFVIKTTYWSNGLYFVKVSTPQQTATQKMLISR